MLTQNMDTSSTKTQNVPKSSVAVGKCLSCGNRLSFCGKPFTAELTCPSCSAVNVYEDSQQPAKLKK